MPEHEHRRRTAPGSSRNRRSIAFTDRRENRDAEDRDEDQEKDVRDRRHRPSDGDGAGDQQDRPDRYRDLDVAATGASSGPRGGPRHPKLRLSEPLRAVSREARNARATNTPNEEPADVCEERHAATVRAGREEPVVRFDELVEEPARRGRPRPGSGPGRPAPASRTRASSGRARSTRRAPRRSRPLAPRSEPCAAAAEPEQQRHRAPASPSRRSRRRRRTRGSAGGRTRPRRSCRRWPGTACCRGCGPSCRA